MFAPPPLPRTLAASLRDLGSEKPAVRASAIGDLARHALRDDETRKRAIPLLVARLKDDSGQVRGAAAVALGDLEAKEALPALLVAVEDDVMHVRQMAINALGEIGDSRALARIERALRDDRPDVRYQAVMAFCRIAHQNGGGVASALARAARDEDDAVRYIALRMAEERLDDVPADRDELAVLANDATELLADRSVAVRLAAGILLAKLGDARGRDLVAKVVRGDRIGDHAPEKEDEQEAVEMAGRLGLEECIPHLEKRVWGLSRFLRDTCPFHAKIALARLGHERARAEILRDLESGSRSRRAAAVVAAGRAGLTAAKPRLFALAKESDEHDLALVAEALAKLS